MTDRLRRAAAETVGELQQGEDPSGFGQRLESGPVARREVGMQLRRHPAAALEFQAVLAETYAAQHLPDWTKRGACAGLPTADWFTDEVADTSPLELPETVYDALRVCSGCPVQRECLTYAYEREERLSDHWSEATAADSDRFGTYAVPGRIRERFAALPDRVARCLSWLAGIASSPERHWVPAEAQEDTETA